jgi:hypothetical protein
MSVRVSHGRRGPCPALLAPLLAAAAIVTSVGGAVADTPEYWSRETFNTERPTITAALTNYDDDAPQPARRQTPRVSAVEGDDVRPARQDQRAQAKAKPKPKPVRVASLGNTYVPPAKPERSISGGGGVRWVASAGCLNGSLRGVIAQVAARFGSVTVNSTCRSRRHNARVGGASRSMHLTGNAADFRIHGNWGAAAGFIRGLVGGFKHYCGGLFHIDTGTKRTW